MNKIQIKQIEDKPGCHIFVDGTELKNCVTSIQFPDGIQPGPCARVVLNVIGKVDIDLKSADIKVQENAHIQG